ncbi:Nitrilase family, member 2 [Seminavis robusta]|uniref:Nitrilase family, member 2 n=1 Tax=Seminavis robusta TaxID=568900 RepID=A0A9N8E7G8_9STRA|nr:Nitrilase family, member 2 [Seminavis robusta]|eukprot:Sro628_g178120.1 Nitrilase family, member 2 (282) ;mRNA; r:46516-47460
MMPSSLDLPESFAPTEYEVIIGRGRRIAEHAGNKRLHRIVATFVEEYGAVPTKRHKSSLLSKVVTLIRNDSEYKAGFVKKDSKTGRWRIVEDAAARITVAQSFRDLLSESYRSSKHFKQQRRQDRKGSCRQQKSASFERTVETCFSSFLQTRTSDVQGSELPSLDIRWSAAASPSNVPDGLSTLLSRLEASVDLTVDPFEPTPISETRISTTGDHDNSSSEQVVDVDPSYFSDPLPRNTTPQSISSSLFGASKNQGNDLGKLEPIEFVRFHALFGNDLAMA